jgi:hypothetical protein
METAPAELSAAVVMSTGADGSPTISVAPTWTGDPSGAQAIVERLSSLGKPVLAKIASTTCSEMLGRYDDVQVVNGRYNEVQTRWLDHLSENVITELMEGYESRRSQLSSVVLHHFHGMGTDIDRTATPFAMRESHFTVLIYSTWEGDTDSDAPMHRRWARELSARLAPYSLPGGYANLLSSDAVDQIDAAFGENAARLHKVKALYDPDNVFSSAIPLPR